MLSKELRAASQIVALVGLIFSLLMFIPWLAALGIGWRGGEPFLWSGLTSGFGCILILLATRGETPRISARFGIIVVNFLWWTIPLICALPFMLALPDLSTADAIFEATSGLTTTGATILSDLVNQSRPILLWRAIMQWIGGLGILSLGLILLPFLRVGGMQLFRMESSDRAEKPLPRLIEISKSIILIYLGLSGVCTLAYLAAGVAPFDSIAHAMTTVATGGFSTHDESLGYYQDSKVLWVAIVFMFLGGLPFSFFIALFFTRSLPKPDPQIYFFIVLILIASFIVIAVDLKLTEFSFFKLSQYIFNVVAIITTTGYASGDFMSYSGVGPVLFFFLIFIGGCAGSTSGGIKIYRFVILAQLIRSSLNELIYSRGVFLIRYGRQVVDQAVFRSAIIMITTFLSFLAIFTIILGAMGLDFITALSGAASALANVGPGIGDVIGPTGNYSSLDDPEKRVLTIAMILGRLELLVVMALFLPILWRD
ncbi:MAG: TrkH family potassium uptake protein [Paracoccaceae bacterium]